MASAAEQLASNLNWGSIGKATELKKRLWFTLGALIVCRLGTYIPVPGVDATVMGEILRQHVQVGQFIVAPRIRVLARVGVVDPIHLRALQQRVAVHLRRAQRCRHFLAGSLGDVAEEHVSARFRESLGLPCQFSRHARAFNIFNIYINTFYHK